MLPGDPSEVVAKFLGKHGFFKFCTWQRRTLPVLVLGHGCGAQEDKLSKCDHQLVLETGLKLLDRRRLTVRSWLADQGVDLDVGDSPNFREPDQVRELSGRLTKREAVWDSAEASNSFYFPRSMSTADTLHIIFNALEDAMTTSDAWPPFEPVFRELVTFIGDRKKRERIIGVCLQGAPKEDRHVLHSFEGSKFEWRFWGNLEDQTIQLAVMWPVLSKRWSYEKLSKDGELGTAHLRNVDKALGNTEDGLEGVEAMLCASSVLSQAAGFNARWARGCRCHDDIQLENFTYKKRRRFLRDMEECGDHDGICMWSGRNGAPMALGAVENMCDVMMGADSVQLRQALAGCGEGIRVTVLSFMTHVRRRWCEQVRSKLAFRQKLPHLFCGLFGMYFGYAKESCRELACRILVKLRGDSAGLHRVALAVLQVEARVLDELENFASMGGDLHAYPYLFVFVLEYVLQSIVSHFVEGRHRQISLRASGASMNCSPGLQSAGSRRREGDT